MSKQQLFARCFPRLLKYVLDEADKHGFNDIFSWSPDGKQFHISDIDIFMKEVAPKYFSKQSNASSFYRQLNLWGFERVGKTRQKSSTWKHDHFIRDEPERIKFMKRCAVKDVTPTKTSTQIIKASKPSSVALEGRFTRNNNIDVSKLGKWTCGHRDDKTSIQYDVSHGTSHLKSSHDTVCTSVTEATIAASASARRKNQYITQSPASDHVNNNLHANNNLDNRRLKTPYDDSLDQDVVYRTVSLEESNSKPKQEKIMSINPIDEKSEATVDMQFNDDDDDDDDDSCDTPTKAANTLVEMMAGRKGKHPRQGEQK